MAFGIPFESENSINSSIWTPNQVYQLPPNTQFGPPMRILANAIHKSIKSQ